MFKNVKNNKGFTLIELLAVIVIMGVLMMVAIPQVTKYIENSKKDAYVETSKAYINAVRYALLNDELSSSLPESGSITVKLNEVTVESGGEKSPYGKDINDYLCYSLGLKNRQDVEKYKTYKIKKSMIRE